MVNQPGVYHLSLMSPDMFRNFRVHSFYIPDCVHKPLFVAVCPTDTLEHVTQRIFVGYIS